MFIMIENIAGGNHSHTCTITKTFKSCSPPPSPSEKKIGEDYIIAVNLKKNVLQGKGIFLVAPNPRYDIYNLHRVFQGKEYLYTSHRLSKCLSIKITRSTFQTYRVHIFLWPFEAIEYSIDMFS